MSQYQYFSFMTTDQNLQLSMQGEYNLLLVLLSLMVASMASYAAFMLSERVSFAAVKHSRHAWLAVGAFTLGFGVWAAHFIAMLALSLPIIVSYNVTITMISVIPAVLAGYMVFLGIGRQAKEWQALSLRSLLMGGGIGAMHYIGMAAMQFDGVMRVEPGMFLLSLVVAVVLSALSLKVKSLAEKHTAQDVGAGFFNGTLFFAALIMGLAISAMHYTGMAAVHFFAVEQVAPITGGVDRFGLASAIGLVVLLLMGLLLVAVRVSRNVDFIRQIKEEMARRKVVEATLNDNEAYLSAVISSAAEAIVTLDEYSKIVSVNPAAEALFAYNEEGLLGQPLSLILPSQGDAKLLLQASFDGQCHSYEETQSKAEFEAVRKDGSVFCMEINIAIMPVKQSYGFVLTIRDISERKRIESLKSEFIATVSHELRTPLTAIKGALGLVVDGKMLGDTDHKVSSLLDIAKDNAARLHLVINDILDIQKIEGGEEPYDFIRMSLRDIASMLVRRFQGKVEQVGSSLVIDDQLSDENGLVLVDQEQVMLLLGKLIMNAIRFSPEKGVITIKLDIDQHGLASISICDQGPGVPASFQSRMYDRFTQLDSKDTRIPGGTGMGLAIAKAIAEKHVGDILYQDLKSGGAMFSFVLPLIGNESELPVNDAVLPNILVVEDDASVGKIVSGLMSNEYNVVQAFTVKEAAHQVQTHKWALVIMDMTLPDGRVEDVLALIEALEPVPPLVVFSAEEVNEALKVRVDAALVKTRVSNQQLVDMIRAMAVHAA